VDAQEITEELEHPGARNLLASATLLRLAYNGSDGFPRVIPIGFYWNGNQIVVCTAATAPKVKALSSRPNVAMTIDVGDTPTAWARKRGHRRRRSRRVRRGIDEGIGRRPGHGVRAPGQVDVRPDGTYLHRAGVGAVLRLRCWPHAVLPDEAGGRRLTGSRRATSPNLTSSFVLCEPLQSGPLATRIRACGPAGSPPAAGCVRAAAATSRAAACRSQSAKRSRSPGRAARRSARSRGDCGGRRRRSRASSSATRTGATAATGRRRRTRWPLSARAVPGRPSWPRTCGCARSCRTICGGASRPSRSPGGCAAGPRAPGDVGVDRDDLPVAVCAFARRAQARADSLPAYRPGSAQAGRQVGQRKNRIPDMVTSPSVLQRPTTARSRAPDAKLTES
jgi:hypothetical protein